MASNETPEFFDTFLTDLNGSSVFDIRLSANITSAIPDQELYEVPVGIIVLLSVCYGTVSVLTVIGNFCVLWIVASSRRMRSVTNYFIANLAFADIIIGMFCIPFQFQAALLQRWVLPWFMCAFCPFVQVLSVNVSTLTLTAIAVDRYRAVMYPLKARTTKMRAKVAILAIWGVSAGASVPCAVAWRVTLKTDHVRNITTPFCDFAGMTAEAWKTYNQSLVCLQYFVPLTLITFTYLRMGIQLRNTQTPGNAQDDRDAKVLKNKKKVIKMLVTVVALFAICWLPFQTYNALKDIFPQIDSYKYINVIWFFCHWLAMSNSCYNPFIYAIYNERFNTEFRKRFRICCRNEVITPPREHKSFSSRQEEWTTDIDLSKKSNSSGAKRRMVSFNGVTSCSTFQQQQEEL